MDTFLSPISLFILVFVGVLLMIIAYFLFTMKGRKTGNAKYLPKGKPGTPGVCPICCTVLKKDEQLKTKVYPSEGTDRLCSIYGCPHCYPIVEPDADRFCPVCKAPVPTDSYLIARLFDRGKKDRHVHILGCRVCRHA
jgi:hypothetical protein